MRWNLKFWLFVSSLFLLFFSINGFATTNSSFKIEHPRIILSDVPFEMTVSALKGNGQIDTSFSGMAEAEGLFQKIFKEKKQLTKIGPFKNGVLHLRDVILPGSATVSFSAADGEINLSEKITVMPGYLSLLPPLLAIILALALREVLLALFSGIWLGAMFLWGYNPFIGLMRALDTYMVNSLFDKSHIAIVMFSMTLGGMVGVISRSGGTQGIVEKISRWAHHPRNGQIATWLLGVIIFFDDYANTLIVGNTMRPLTDKIGISREKLSYIVDSTAAPVASIAIISSWVGFQVGLIDQAFNNINVPHDAYITFLRSIPFASYSVLAIIFVFLIGFTLRDFGPMYKAEHRSFLTGKVLRDGAQPIADDKSLDIMPEEGIPLRWYNAAIPILIVIFGTMIGLYYSGRVALGDQAGTARLGEIIGNADSFSVLMWSSFSGAFVAIFLAVTQRILSMKKALDAWLNGVRAMVIAMIILILAWTIGEICGELKTADYVIAVTRDLISPHVLPMLTFIVAAFIGFSTGTSWATMAILVPIVVPMAFKLTVEAQLSASLSNSILLGTIGAVLSGSVFGDHCSPISDTTIMSSMTSAADHIDHVRTQLPYAVAVGLVAIFVGYLPAGFGFPSGLSILAGVLVFLIILFTLGKRIDSRDEMLN
ncbi:MAG: Na+/H+ antiporter NhaC family protein [Calditrichaeota bacterium]|nr:Na+/H+ antiporter NhaC family protein [Calditrichota bacterium]